MVNVLHRQLVAVLSLHLQKNSSIRQVVHVDRCSLEYFRLICALTFDHFGKHEKYSSEQNPRT